MKINQSILNQVKDHYKLSTRNVNKLTALIESVEVVFNPLGDIAKITNEKLDNELQQSYQGKNIKLSQAFEFYKKLSPEFAIRKTSNATIKENERFMKDSYNNMDKRLLGSASLVVTEDFISRNS